MSQVSVARSSSKNVEKSAVETSTDHDDVVSSAASKMSEATELIDELKSGPSLAEFLRRRAERRQLLKYVTDCFLIETSSCANLSSSYVYP